MNKRTELTKKFLQHIKEDLELSQLPNINFNNTPGAASQMKSFGSYTPEDKSIVVNIYGRCLADSFRTLLHEIIHYKQDLEGRLYEGAGETGSDIENEANIKAAVGMRNFSQKYPEIYNF